VAEPAVRWHPRQFFVSEGRAQPRSGVNDTISSIRDRKGKSSNRSFTRNVTCCALNFQKENNEAIEAISTVRSNGQMPILPGAMQVNGNDGGAGKADGASQQFAAEISLIF